MKYAIRYTRIENPAIYVPKGASTIVESSLQIELFMQNKAKVKIGKMNISIAAIKDYGKYNKQSTTNVMQNKAKQSQFKAKKMLLRLTINGRRESFGYYADEIEAPNACDRAAG